MMAKRNRQNTAKAKNPHTFRRDLEWVAERDRHAASGAAGIHADQNAKQFGVPYTNRTNTRSAIKRISTEDGW